MGFKMKLNAEYNEHVVGYVVTDTNTGRSVNFQFEEDRATNHPEPRYFLTYGCTGDHTYQVFNEAELEQISDFVKQMPFANQIEEAFTEIMHSHLVNDFQELHAKNGCIFASDIIEYAERIENVFVIECDGELQLDDHYETSEQAQKVIDEDFHEGCNTRILNMPLAELYAYQTIESHASNTKQELDIVKAFDDSIYSDSRQFVIEQLYQIQDETPINREYFKYLISTVYSITDTPVWNNADEPDFNFEEPMTFKAYVAKHINDLVKAVFNQEISIEELIKA